MTDQKQHNHSEGGFSQLMGKFLHWAYNLYVLGTVLSFCYVYFGLPLEAKDLWISRILSIGVAVFIILQFLHLIYFAFTYSEKAKYAEIVANLHQVHHLIRDLTSQLKKYHYNIKTKRSEVADKAELRVKITDEFSRILTQIAVAISITKGVNCRSAIKILGKLNVNAEVTPENAFVRTLARDLASAHTCKEKDELEGKNNLVSENTDFTMIIKRLVLFFFTGDVNNEGNYINSSKTFWEKINPSVNQLREKSPLFKKIVGIYPYRSVMVFPIKGSLGEVTDNMPILGFLCIDSKAKNCFNPRYDVDLGASFADSLYHALRAYVMLMVLLPSSEGAHA